MSYFTPSGWESQKPTTPRQHSDFQLSNTRDPPGSNTRQTPGNARPGNRPYPSAQTPAIRVFDDKESEKKSVSKDYDIIERLGMGAFGVVKKGRDRRTGKEVAIKCIRKADCKPEELRQEVRLLRMVKGYPGIVTLEGVYESRNKVNIIMELISGGELFDAIVENEFYSEKDASELVRQMATTIEYCHSKNVVHRDLKPENLLFEKKGSNILKLIDFGIATILDDGKQLYEVVGSRTYMAPEIDRRVGYGKSVDMYAIGVIMYILLCGYPPFDYDQGIYELAFNSPEWDEISEEAKDIIRTQLSDDPSIRHTATELKNHQWVSGRTAPQKTLTNNIHATIKNYVAFNNMKTKYAPNGRDKRTSIYGLFNIARKDVPGTPTTPQGKPEQQVIITSPQPVVPSSNEANLIQNLKVDLRTHMKGFTKLKEQMLFLSNNTHNETLKIQLVKTVEEVNFLTNAYKELVDMVLPNLNKGLSGAK